MNTYALFAANLSENGVKLDSAAVVGRYQPFLTALERNIANNESAKMLSLGLVEIHLQSGMPLLGAILRLSDQHGVSYRVLFSDKPFAWCS